MALDLVATLRFNDNLTQGLRRARDQINHTSDSMNVLGRNSAFSSLTSKVGGLVAALGSAIGAQKLLNATIGEAMRFEQSEVLVEAMFDDTKASKQYAKMVEEMALASPIMDSSTMMGNSKAFVSITKDLPTLKEAWGIAEKLSILDPEQGLKGAIYAMKELASGDGVSMAQRFEMPKSVVNDIKKLPFDQQLNALQDYLDTTGITSKTVTRMGETTLAKWGGIQERLTSAFRQFGSDGNSALSKAFDGVLAGLDSGAFDGLTKMIDSGLGKAVTAMTAWIQRVDWQDVATKAENVFQQMTSAVSTAATFIKTHWDTIVFATKAVVTAFVSLKALSFVVGVFATVSSAVATGIRIFRALKTALTVAKTAFLIMRGVMLMFPGTWIVAAIGAVIAVGIALYKNWDTVKAKTSALWAKFKETAAFKAIQSGMDKVMSVANKVKGAFSALKEGVSYAMSQARIAVTDSVNGIIDKVNWLIEKLNAIPGVNVPLVAHVKYDTSGSVDTKVANVSNSGSAASNSVNGPHAIGNHGGWNEIRTDGTLRNLHAGERVLTAVENDSYKQMMNSGLPNAIAKMASLKPTSISSVSESNTTNMNNVNNHTTSNVSNTTNAYSTTNDSVTQNYTTSAFELPAFNEVPILNAIRNLSNAAGTAPIQESFKLDVTDVVTAIDRLAKRAINVYVPNEDLANKLSQMVDVVSDKVGLTSGEAQAVSSTVENSSFSDSVNTITTNNAIAKTASTTNSKVVEVGGITLQATVREEADVDKIAAQLANKLNAYI